MNNPFVVEAVRASVEDVFLVGGYIRDSLMGLDAEGDMDFATSLKPEEVKNRLENSGFKVIDYSEQYGTVSTIISKTKVEITTFRGEKYPPSSRKPEVIFIKSLSEDLARRDFTMNAIAHDGENYIDPYNGQQDIINEKIRAVGDPEERFKEDPLRILRAMRFISTLGFTLEARTYAAIFTCSNFVASLSGERISSEIEKILTGDHWIQAISVGLEAKTFEYVFNLKVPDAYLSDFIELISDYSEKYPSNDIRTRWMIVIISILNLAKNQSSQSRENILNVIFEKLKQRLVWSNRSAEYLYERVKDEAEKESLMFLENELKQLEKNNDSRKYIVEEKLLRIKIRASFNERNFKQLLIQAQKIIEVQNKNLEIKKRTSVSRNEAITKTAPRIYLILKYVCACRIYKFGYIEGATKLNKIIGDLIKAKDIFDVYELTITQNERAKIVEDGLIMLMNLMPGRITELSIAEVQEFNKYIKTTQERLILIKDSYLRQLITQRHEPLKDGAQLQLARLNIKVADLLLAINNNEKDITYYIQLSDAYKCQALASKNKKEFWNSFEKMNLAMDEIDKLNDEQPNHIYHRYGQYLDTAKCLVYVMTLEKELDKKIDLANSIIVNYKMAGNSYERNVPRYRLLKDWLVLVKKLLESDAESALKILKEIPSIRSHDYVDSDEAYVADHLPEILTIRQNMKDIESYLFSVYQRSDDVIINHEQLSASAILVRGKLIDVSFALEIFKRVIKAQVNQGITIEPLTVLAQSSNQSDLPNVEQVNENLKLIQLGESETVEFKESWRYDTKAKELDPKKVVRQSALKAMASFMNTGGGTLFIGVNDKGTVTGLEYADFLIHKKKNLGRLQLQDELKRNIDDAFATSLGAAASVLKKVTFDIIDGKTVAVIKIKASKEPVFLDKKLYVRNSASSRLLDTEESFKFFKSKG